MTGQSMLVRLISQSFHKIVLLMEGVDVYDERLVINIAHQ